MVERVLLNSKDLTARTLCISLNCTVKQNSMGTIWVMILPGDGFRSGEVVKATVIALGGKVYSTEIRLLKTRENSPVILQR